jgi:DNA processing protein
MTASTFDATFAREWLSLVLIPGVSAEAVRRLLKALGSPAAVLGASDATRQGIVGAKPAAALRAGPADGAIEKHLAWLDEPNHHMLTLADSDYPPRLLQISDPPPTLFIHGHRALLAAPMLAIVGSRNATPQGGRDAFAFARSLSDAGLVVASGLALGIDAAAHEGALAGRAGSVAVIGTGADRIYPARNEAIARALAEQGAVVSEFPLGTPPLKENFPRRNRIISGLSLGVLVVEAAIASGSLITARTAGEQGREVFAIPGSIHSPFSRGCHALIKEGAKLVESAEDVLSELRWQPVAPIIPLAASASSPAEPPAAATVPNTVPNTVLNASAAARTQAQAEPAPSLAPESAEARIHAAMGHAPIAPEAIASTLALPIHEVLAALITLELAGRVAAAPGGLYQRLEA